MLSNLRDVLYSCNVTLGGKDFPVVIDTGSSDLWITGGRDLPGAKNLSTQLELDYAIGNVIGFVNTVQLDFDGFTIQEQAFLNAEVNNDTNVPGFLGLGPNRSSVIRKQLGNSSSADPPLDRIFRTNLTTPNFLTFFLSRNSSVEGPVIEEFPAQLTVGTVIPGLEAILDAPKLPVIVDQFGNQHWQTLLDTNGISGPNGQGISTTTSIKNPTNGTANQLHVVFDSGFTVPQLPADVVDAIYGPIPGAEFFKEGQKLHPDLERTNFWRIPCDYEVNVSFIFAGQEYPISPLDLSLDTQLRDNNNSHICVANYHQMADNVQGNPIFGAVDAYLGMGFLRNIYILINFGDFLDGSPDNVAGPYIQLLSVSNKTQIHLDFVNARLGGGENNQNNTAGSMSPGDNHSNDGGSTGSDDQNSESNHGGDNQSTGNGSDRLTSHKRAALVMSLSVVGLLMYGSID